MDLTKQKESLEKLLNAVTLRMESRLNIVTTKEANAHSLMEVAQDYCKLLGDQRMLKDELERVNAALSQQPVNTA